MGLDKWDTLKDYWSTLEKFYMPFYSKMMKLLKTAVGTWAMLTKG
jgi:hypothetical protein